MPAPDQPADVDLADLGLDAGAHVLIKTALTPLAAGDRVRVRGTHPDLVGQVEAWCRQQGHRIRPAGTDPDDRSTAVIVERGPAAGARWIDAERAGGVDSTAHGAVHDEPPARWGLAARGAAIERGGPEPRFALDRRDELWTDRAAGLYAQAAGAQWDPWSAIDWDTTIVHGPVVEAAVVQVMTFLVENEEAALVVPARFLGQVHPHFREIQQTLAVTVADEARHLAVFNRRIQVSGLLPALSTVGGRASLQTLLDEPDFATASFLLSVMGEGTFVSLLGFLERHAPDALTRRIAQLTRTDEARHVAFALGHLRRHADIEPDLRPRLARAAERRHHALRATVGLNEDVFDALVLLAAGDTTPGAVATGWRAVQDLQADMDEGRRNRLAHLGFTTGEAEEISSLHTRNFM